MLRTEPLDGRAFRSGSVDVVALAPATRLVLRAAADALEPIRTATGWPVRSAALEAHLAGSRAALNLGPDEWLLMDEEAAPSVSAFEEIAVPHSLVDVSHRQTGVAVAGPGAADLLAAGCPLDLSLAKFPVGRCSRTVLGKVEITLWRKAGEEFRVEFWRSYSTYVWRYLEQAARAL